jgi:predicted nucleotidyltransferase/plasmid maintenance system antidote protein VapI
LTNNVKTIIAKTMETLGEMIRRYRLEKQLPLRKVAACLDIDQAILSKIERGQRKSSRELLSKFSACLGINKDDLMVAWLADKLVYEILDEEHALKAIKVAEELILYKKAKPKTDRQDVLEKLQDVLKKDGRIKTAWIFGSFARKTDTPESDLDLMVEMEEGKNYSMFDLLDISYKIEQQIHRKVDLVEKGTLKDFALKTAQTDFMKVYG